MSEIKYPVYRKYYIGGNYIGGVYGKQNSDGSSVIIKFAMMDPNNFTIQHFVKPSAFDEMREEGFVDATRDEWEKAYGKA